MGRFKRIKFLMADTASLPSGDPPAVLSGSAQRLATCATQLKGWVRRGRPVRRPWDTGKFSANFRVLRWRNLESATWYMPWPDSWVVADIQWEALQGQLRRILER